MDIDPDIYNKISSVHKAVAMDLINKIVEQNPDKKFNIILDIGCGSGNVTALLDNTFDAKQVYGVDIDEKMIGFANINNSNGSITYFAEDMSKRWDQLSLDIREREGEVGLIFSSMALHWIKDRQNLCQNMFRLLAIGGKMCANIVHIESFHIALSPEEERVVKLPTLEENSKIWIELFETNGLNVISKDIVPLEWSCEMKDFEKIALPVILALRRVYIEGQNIAKGANCTKFDSIIAQILADHQSYVDKETGKVMHCSSYELLQFVLAKN